MSNVPVAALLPVLALAVLFVGYSLRDLIRQPEVRYLPKPVWGVLLFVSVPLGGIAYLLLGRSTSGALNGTA